MNRYITRFSELGPPDVKDSEFEVDIRSVQTQGFVHPHSGRYQQAEEGRISAGAKSVERGELLTSAKDVFNLFIAVDVKRRASVAMREKSCGANVRDGLGGATAAGE